MEGDQWQDDRWERIQKSIERAKLGDNEERRINIRGMRLQPLAFLLESPPPGATRAPDCNRQQLR